jgi:hypothetical protein
MKKRLIGKYHSFTFKGRTQDLSGVILAYNANYTLVRQCIDYCPDGYRIFKNEKVEYIFGDHEKIATKILKLKKYSTVREPRVPIDVTPTI